MKTIGFYILLICLGWSLISCGELNVKSFLDDNSITDLSKPIIQPTSLVSSTGKLAETAIPKRIEQLNKSLEQLTPQVSIVNPQANQVFNDTSINVKLKIQNLSLFKDDKLGMGPHLNLILDNEPGREIYSTEEPITIDNLSPGTHTIRVFAARPWHESFKNEGAYAQTTFHILTKTNSNNPDPNLPLLTYSHPQGTYGAEPIMLDFYLTNAPLHVVARENPNDDIKDWRIRVSVNGESFIIDRWQPIYLKGFTKGNNWVQLELLDEEGNSLENIFNNTVQLVTYDPQQQNTLDKLVTGNISLEQARPIVEQNYYIQPVGIPEVIEEETLETTTPVESELTTEDEEISSPVIPETEPEVVSEPLTTEIEPDNPLEKESQVDSQEATEIPIPPSETKIQEEVVNEKLETSAIKSEEVIKITQPNSLEEEPTVVLEIPQEDSVTITEDEIVIEPPKLETTKTSEPQLQSKIVDWIKNTWNKLQQKAKDIAQMFTKEGNDAVSTEITK
ncbi:MAG: hypothetical protein Tsb0014_31680 [Pleurocapsa sp.]